MTFMDIFVLPSPTALRLTQGKFERSLQRQQKPWRMPLNILRKPQELWRGTVLRLMKSWRLRIGRNPSEVLQADLSRRLVMAWLRPNVCSAALTLLLRNLTFEHPRKRVTYTPTGLCPVEATAEGA